MFSRDLLHSLLLIGSIAILVIFFFLYHMFSLLYYSAQPLQHGCCCYAALSIPQPLFYLDHPGPARTNVSVRQPHDNFLPNFAPTYTDGSIILYPCVPKSFESHQQAEEQ